MFSTQFLIRNPIEAKQTINALMDANDKMYIHLIEEYRNVADNKLKKLDLKCNELQILPDSIGHLINLETLNLEQNKITSISEEIKLCSQLKNLNLASNELLDKLPDSIGNLTRLETIQIVGCKKIKSLPLSISNLSNLLILDLNWTSIPKLPDELFQLKSLVELKLFNLYI